MKLLTLSLLLTTPVFAASAATSATPISPTLVASVFPCPAPTASQCANVTAAPDGTLHLTYAGPAPASAEAGARTLWHATLAPRAAAFSAPRLIVTTPLLMENWADFASLAVGTDGALTAQWFQKSAPDAGGYEGWFARSTDGGATWTKPAPLGHEFVALAPLSGGRTLAVWLESTRPRDPNTPRVKRTAAPAPPAAASHDHADHAPRDPATPYAPSMKLLSRLLAPDGSTLGEWTIDPDVCTCCQNTLAVLPGDRVFAAYRSHTAAEIRDNQSAIFDLATHSWSAPITLKDDHWKIPACPVNGPAADARGSALAVAWFTAANGIARVQAKYSADAGRTFTAPLVLDLGHPMGRLETVLLADSTALILWMEAGTTANAAGIYARRLWPDGHLSAPHLIADSTQARASGFPRAALRPTGHILVAFTQSGDTTQVRTLDVDPTSLKR